MYAYLRSEFLFDGDLPEDYPVVERCLLISVKAKLGYDLEFQVLTCRGVLRDKLPISALWSDLFYEAYTQRQLQRWCCPSSYLTVVELPLNTGKVWIGNEQVPFEYQFTVDFGSGMELEPGSDVSLPEEHKAMHIIKIDNQFAAMPNNSLVWDHPTLVPIDKQLTTNPGYKVTTKTYCVESYMCAKASVANNVQLYDAAEPTSESSTKGI
jgi:hypothetical protein